MAVALEGFSIREYAAKMRSVDVLKCYPFRTTDEMMKKNNNKEEVAALLPPITVTKFKWWAQELDRLRASDNGNGATTTHHQEVLTLLNKESSEIPINDIEFTAVRRRVEVVGEVAPLVCQARKPKSKAPKKRSIADIFAVAPPIRTQTSEDEDEDEDDCEALDESNSSSKATKKVKKRKKVTLVREKDKKFNIKKKKENSCNLKVQNPVSFAKKLNKSFALDVRGTVTVRARTPNLKYLSGKKRKAVQTFKSAAKHQKPIFSIRSILKNPDVCGQNSTFCSTQGDNSFGVQHSKRHVKFSTKDHILGPRKKGLSSSDDDTGNSLSDAIASSSENDQSADSNEEAAPAEVDRREKDTLIGTDKASSDRRENEVSSIIRLKESPKIPGHADIPRILRPYVTPQETERNLPDESIPASRATGENNLIMSEQSYSTTSPKPAHAGIQSLISALEESCVSSQGVTVSRDCDSMGMIDHIVHPIHGVAAMSSRAITGAFHQPSSNFTFIENPKERLPFPSQSEIDKFHDHGLYCQSLHPPTGLIGGSSYRVPDGKQRAATLKESGVDKEFFGLPLNSQGELIQLSPRGRSGLKQLRKLNMMPRSSSSLPAEKVTPLASMNNLPPQNVTHLTGMDNFPFPQQNLTHSSSIRECLTANNKNFSERELSNGHLNLFPMQNYVKQNPSSHFPERLGVTSLESTLTGDVHQLGFESRSSHSFCRFGSDLNLMNVSISGCRQVNQVQNQNTGGIIPKENSGHTRLNMNQPTMRLMGKDVAIGKSSREVRRFEDGKVWTDKEIIAEHRPSSTALHDPSLQRSLQQNLFPHMTSGKSKESTAQFLEHHSEPTPLEKLLMRAEQSRFPHPYHNWESNSVFRNGSVTDYISPSPNLIHFAQFPTPLSATFNRAPPFQKPFVSARESLLQRPVFSAPQNTCGHGVLRPAELDYKQNPPHFTKSAFTFPFLNPECSEDVQSPWFQSSSKGLPPWLLHATTRQGKPPNTASQAFPNLGTRHHEQVMPWTDIYKAPSVHRSSEVSHPCNLVASHSQVKSSPSPRPGFLPPLPANAGVKPRPASAIKMDYRNRMKLSERLKSKAFGIRDPYPCKKTNRHVAVKAAVDSTSTKPPNMLNYLEILQEKLSTISVAESSKGSVCSEMQSNVSAVDLDSSRKKASDADCRLNETQEDRFGTTGSESSKVDATFRSSGPIKLSAGAKHIIKPTQFVDPDKSRPINSTISSVAVNNGCREADPQKKSTKIYRF